MCSFYLCGFLGPEGEGGQTSESGQYQDEYLCNVAAHSFDAAVRIETYNTLLTMV